MFEDSIIIVVRLLMALLAGGFIGLERAFQGRPAGLRTHSLVCMASSLLMLLTVHQWDLLVGVMPSDSIRVDPTRMAQGIMTGIGFLGAGVIMKEKLTVRGLTTAASIWMTASIGIIIGMGFYVPAVLATGLSLLILSAFRRLEYIMPSRKYGRLAVRFFTPNAMSKDELFELIRKHAIDAANISYQLVEEGKVFEYRMTVRTLDPENFCLLALALRDLERVLEFSIQPTGD